MGIVQGFGACYATSLEKNHLTCQLFRPLHVDGVNMESTLRDLLVRNSHEVCQILRLAPFCSGLHEEACPQL